eukprot:Skav206130  [mRNA]  locus=scaffold172:391296:392144:+ [translate_table: standard]
MEDQETIVAWITHDSQATIPAWIRSQLKGHYGLDWFYHQLATCLLRPTDRLQKAIQQQIEASGVPTAPFLSVHFRAGTKLAKEEGFRRPLELYLSAIREAARLKGLNNVLWESDDTSTFQKIQVLAETSGLKLNWFQVPRRLFPAERAQTDKSLSLHPMEIVNNLKYDSDEMSDEGLQVLALVFFLSASSYGVLGHSSGVGRLISIFRGNMNLHDVDNLIWADGPPQMISGTQCFLHDTDCNLGHKLCAQRELIRRNRTATLKRHRKYDRSALSRFSDQDLL